MYKSRSMHLIRTDSLCTPEELSPGICLQKGQCLEDRDGTGRRETGKWGGTRTQRVLNIKLRNLTFVFWLTDCITAVTKSHRLGGPVIQKLFFKIFFVCGLWLFCLWLYWVFVAARGLSLVAASWGYSLLRCMGFSLQCLLLLWSTGSRHVGFSSCQAGA